MPPPAPNTLRVTSFASRSVMTDPGTVAGTAPPAWNRRSASCSLTWLSAFFFCLAPYGSPSPGPGLPPPPLERLTSRVSSTSSVWRQYRKNMSSSSSYPRLQKAQNRSTLACSPALLAASALHITSHDAFSASALTPYCRAHCA